MAGTWVEFICVDCKAVFTALDPRPAVYGEPVCPSCLKSGRPFCAPPKEVPMSSQKPKPGTSTNRTAEPALPLGEQVPPAAPVSAEGVVEGDMSPDLGPGHVAPESAPAAASAPAAPTPEAVQPAPEPPAAVVPFSPPPGKLARLEGGPGGIVLRSFEDYWRFAQAVAASKMVKGIQTPEQALLILQHGAEVGLSPMQSLQGVASINGRTAVWGDSMLGIIRASRELEGLDEYFCLGDRRLTNPTFTYPTLKEWPDALTAYCTMRRRGGETLTRTFAVSDARRSGKWGSEGPWQTYPQRQLQWRARSWAGRDLFGDKLRGIASAEEMMDVIEVEAVPEGREPIRAPEAAS